MSGELVWGIKRSFLSYLARVPDARSSVTDGAEVTADGRYRYRSLGDERDGGALRLRYQGSVRFVAHNGQLGVGFTDPIVTIADDEASVSVVDHTAGGVGTRIDLLSGTAVREAETSTIRMHLAGLRLTTAGAERFFAGMYPQGEQFDDMDVVLTSIPTTAY